MILTVLMPAFIRSNGSFS